MPWTRVLPSRHPAALPVSLPPLEPHLVLAGNHTVCTTPVETDCVPGIGIGSGRAAFVTFSIALVVLVRAALVPILCTIANIGWKRDAKYQRMY